MEVLGMVLVQEGLCVLVPCTFTGPNTYSVQVYGSWFHTGADTSQDSAVATNNPEQQVLKETRGRFHLIGNMQSNNCSLDIRDAQRGDNGSYLFMGKQQGKSQRSSCGKPVSVHVTESPQSMPSSMWPAVTGDAAEPTSLRLDVECSA